MRTSTVYMRFTFIRGAVSTVLRIHFDVNKCFDAEVESKLFFHDVFVRFLKVIELKKELMKS